jgi:hypothetical protein
MRELCRRDLSEFFQGNVLSLEFDNQYFMIFLGSLPFVFRSWVSI